MNKNEKIQIAQAEAEKGGYKSPYPTDAIEEMSKLLQVESEEDKSYFGLIFDHSFIRAIFGNGPQYEQMMVHMQKMEEETGDPINEEFLPAPMWKIALERMVVNENPLDVLCSMIDAKDKIKDLKEGVVPGTKDTSSIVNNLKDRFKGMKF